MADPLRSFLSERSPKMLWLQLVDEGAHAAGRETECARFDDAARSLYGVGLQSSAQSNLETCKVFLALGKLCHRTSLLAAQPPPPAGARPPLPSELLPPISDLPSLKGVTVGLDGETRQAQRAVAPQHIDDAYYCLRVQERLNGWKEKLQAPNPPFPQNGDAALNSEELIGQLMELARQLPEQPALFVDLTPTALLALAFDVTHKTAWRFENEQVRFERLAKLLAAALGADLPRWRAFAVEVPRLSDTEVRARLTGLQLFEQLRLEHSVRAKQVRAANARRQEVALGEAGDAKRFLDHVLAAVGLSDGQMRKALVRAQAEAELDEGGLEDAPGGDVEMEG